MNSPNDTPTASKATRVLVILVTLGIFAIGKILIHKEEEEEARWQKFRADHHCVLLNTKTERNAGYVADDPVNQTLEVWKCDDGEHRRSFISE